MLAHSRDESLMDVLRASGSASVSELAASLDVTDATVRRWLQRLAREGRVIRTYGGATVAEGLATLATADNDALLPQKRAIGLAASGLIEDGSTVALSSGSTVIELAKQLRHRDITIITNAIDVAAALLGAPTVKLIVLGGVVLPGMHSTRGHLTEDSMRDLRADTVFLGASAVDLSTGFMTDQVAEVAVDRAMRAMAREAVILADSSKFDRFAPGFMFGFERVGTLVTDARVQASTVEAVVAMGTRVIVGREGGAAGDQ